MKSAGLACAVALVTSAAVAAPPPFELAVDVPSSLGGSTYLPDQVVRRAAGAYSAAVTLPSSVAIGALHRRANGTILFAPEHAVVLGGVTYEARDIVAYDGAAYSMFFDGGAAGVVPANARIDALYLDATGAPVMSFDVPVMLSAVWVGPSNLVSWSGSSWTPVWDATAAGVPAGINVVGADRLPSGELVVTFDVPASIGATTWQPGQLVGWTGTSFENVSADPSWPASSELRDFSFLPAGGDTPETGTGELHVNKAAGGGVALTWGASCLGSDSDYEVYDGSIASGFTSHVPSLCTTGGATTATITPASGDRYFLVVPRNIVAEGSYGTRGDGSERPVSASACLPQTVGACGGAKAQSQMASRYDLRRSTRAMNR